MSAVPENGAGTSRIRWRLVSLALVITGVLIVIGANAHLVHIALQSQPDCVPHLKIPEGDGAFAAARSSC